ncbi:MAG: aminodeoxychorismate/anthranilate synthase component II [Desulfobacterales bacterium]|nr:aminodeoxychorismate/anthranilate synthase component II [Desulfobacterales bacterium]
MRWHEISNKLLVIDNYDSFTYNLVQMFMLYDLKIKVYRNDKITLTEVENFKPNYIVISPGPKNPQHSGISMEIIKNYLGEIPILGVCLGMQCINEVFGGVTVNASVPMHGKTSLIYHTNESIFKNMPMPFKGARYHSLVVNLKGDELSVNAWSDDGIIMGVYHKKYNVYGVQFHPESFLTEQGSVLIENFLKL